MCTNDNIEDPIFILEMYNLNCTYKVNYCYIVIIHIFIL